jgi:hypothetical protein
MQNSVCWAGILTPHPNPPPQGGRELKMRFMSNTWNFNVTTGVLPSSEKVYISAPSNDVAT